MVRETQIFLCVIAATLLVLSKPGRASGSRNERPNVLLIVGDDIGFGDLGDVRCDPPKTPNLDRLAHRGNQLH